jgi:UDP-N-acetylmuramoyl-tripeptide--D-alanyl-D-alanine ligase
VFSYRQIAETVGGVWSGACPEGAPAGFRIDSREVHPDDLFFALQGTRTDGHHFVAEALRRGASAAVVRDAAALPDDGAGIVVPDPLRALRDLAAAWRGRIVAPLVALTGSNGKTTTKALLAHLVAEDLAVYAAPGNYNTEIGLPLALLTMPTKAELGIFELGTEAPGEIEPLACLLRPSLALITSAGPSHLEGFGTVEAVADEKWSLLRVLGDDGWGGVNVDSAPLRRRAGIEPSGPIVTVGLSYGSFRGRLISAVPHLVVEVEAPSMRLESRLIGGHNATNLLLAVACALRLGVEPDRIIKRIRDFAPVRHRLELKSFRDGLLVDDTYNANPASVAAALDVLRALGGPATRRVFVFGEMLGLGPESAGFHDEVATRAVQMGAEVLPVGALAVEAWHRLGKGAVLGRDEIRRELATLLGPYKPTATSACGDNVVLVKGSHAVRLDLLVDALIEPPDYSG